MIARASIHSPSTDIMVFMVLSALFGSAKLVLVIPPTKTLTMTVVMVKIPQTNTMVFSEW